MNQVDFFGWRLSFHWVVFSSIMLWGWFGVWSHSASAQSVVNDKYGQVDKFRQLDEIWPTPNLYRTAAGEPGPGYWQQRADYVIDIQLDDQSQRLSGSQQVTYHNHSPHTLHYLWLHLDGNIFDPMTTVNSLTSPLIVGRTQENNFASHLMAASRSREWRMLSAKSFLIVRSRRSCELT